jgi:hypothetical protein
MANTMTYRDNDVYFVGSYRINGSYEIKSFSITNGQDPDGHIKIGDVFSANSGKISFSAGRKKSEDVAK